MATDKDHLGGSFPVQRVKIMLGAPGVDDGDLSSSIPMPIGLIASENHLGEVGGRIAIPSANFTRPADTTAYTSGDLVANSATAASVVALSWTVARVAAGNGMIRKARIKKSDPTLTNASFRLHLYKTDPALSTGIANGDNGAWSTKHASYLGSFDIVVDKAFSDAAAGQGVPLVGTEINFVLASGQLVYGLLEARAAYTPATSEVFTIELEVVQN